MSLVAGFSVSFQATFVGLWTWTVQSYLRSCWSQRNLSFREQV